VWTTVVALAVLLCIPLVVACLYFGALFLPLCSFFVACGSLCVRLCGRGGGSSFVELGVLLLDILRQLLDFEGLQVLCYVVREVVYHDFLTLDLCLVLCLLVCV